MTGRKRVTSTFGERLTAATRANNSLVCVGLDPDIEKFPEHLKSLDPRTALRRFNESIIGATYDLVCCYKPNLAFYLQYGLDGISALLDTRAMIPESIPVILDCKVGDMGNTAKSYAKGYLGVWGFDAVTVNPYQGIDCVEQFLAYEDRGVLVLCKTSNPSSADFQDIVVNDNGQQRELFKRVASKVQGWSQEYATTLGLVVGATFPAQLGEIRAICPTLPILLPGIGAQAGELEASVHAGLDPNREGMMISSSRAVIFAGDGPDFATQSRAATSDLRDQINALRS
jgi:orotidine-5'-phosphate decarboxylase